MAERADIGREQLLASQVAALEQLLEVYEQAVLEQSEHLEAAQDALARRVDQLADSNTALSRLNEALNREIVEREQAQANLRRSERLASIGTLTAGLAHEINNPLGLIALEAHRASSHADERQTLFAALGEIEGHVRRCARIVKSVLQFTRDETTEKWPIDLNELIAHTRDLTRERAHRAEVALELDLAERLPVLALNPTEMEQVIVNLIQNAINASPPGSHVVVTTEHVVGGVLLSVCDDGCGMSEHDLARAFDPFYTTRSDQGGTGLGLSTCRSIVSDLGGGIEIDSAIGRGTTVTVTLPAPGTRPGEP